MAASRQGEDSENFPVFQRLVRKLGPGHPDFRESLNDVTFVVSLPAESRVCTFEQRVPFLPRALLFVRIRRFIRRYVKDSWRRVGTVCRVTESLNRLEITGCRYYIVLGPSFSVRIFRGAEMHPTFIRFDPRSVLWLSITVNFTWPICISVLSTYVRTYGG